MNTTSILIVDDDCDIRDALADLLRDAGYEVASAGNGLEAMEYLRTGHSPSLILLDLMMPVMNGWQFLVEQRRDPALAAIPVVVVSADHRGLRAVEHEVPVRWLEKPLTVDTLLATVGEYC